MEKNAYVVTKSTVEVYRLRHPSGMYWADITIDEGNESGRISIASDFGDWSNYWGSCGMPFKDFLGKVDKWYAANKFGATNWFDLHKTIKHLNDEVDRQLADESITPDMAEEMRSEISELSDYKSKDAFAVQCFNMEHLGQLYDCGPDLITDIEPGFNHFWDKVWPAMIETFVAEKANLQTKPVAAVADNKSSREYIDSDYGTRRFLRAIGLHDSESILDLMQDYGDSLTKPVPQDPSASASNNPQN